jgi:acyl dehydratase
MADRAVSRQAKLLAVGDYLALRGTTLGTSDWILVDQARIDGFAEVTGDHQFIHVNPELARQTPFGTTIAHGYLTLSLLSRMAYDVLPAVEGTRMGVNYGLNSVRFLAPVKCGSRVRGHFRMADVTERSSGVIQSTVEVTVEIEGEAKPALAAEWVTLVYV